MSHREQHFAGLHYAKAEQIGAKFDNGKHRAEYDSPNSPSLSQIQSLHERVFPYEQMVYYDVSTKTVKQEPPKAHERSKERRRATKNLHDAQKYGFHYSTLQICHACSSTMTKDIAVCNNFEFPVWYCQHCKCYYTTYFEGVEYFKVNKRPLKTQRMRVDS